jgi:hypothetical protein
MSGGEWARTGSIRKDMEKDSRKDAKLAKYEKRHTDSRVCPHAHAWRFTWRRGEKSVVGGREFEFYVTLVVELF